MSEKTLQLKKIKEEQVPDYKNPDLSVDERVSDLLSRMTLEEKVAQMICVWGEKKKILLDENGNLILSNLELYLENGIGQIGRLSDTIPELSPYAMAELTNKLQEYFVERTRLGIPVIQKMSG
jgi:beta-glucosidase